MCLDPGNAEVVEVLAGFNGVVHKALNATFLVFNVGDDVESNTDGLWPASNLC